MKSYVKNRLLKPRTHNRHYCKNALTYLIGLTDFTSNTPKIIYGHTLMCVRICLYSSSFHAATFKKKDPSIHKKTTCLTHNTAKKLTLLPIK